MINSKIETQGSHIKKEWSQVGGRICQATKAFCITTLALQRLCERTLDSPGRVATMSVTAATGLTQLYNGDIIGGAICTGLAIKEFANIYGTKANKSEVARLISDAKANVQMISTLEESNKKSFDLIDINLSLVHENVNKLNGQLAEIRALATDGSEKLQTQKEIVLSLNKEASDLFEQAQTKLMQGQHKIVDAQAQFKKALGRFDDLIESAESTDGDLADRMADFVKKSKKIHQECVTASDLLEEFNPTFKEGVDLLNAAIAKQTEAAREMGKTLQMAAEQKQNIAEKAVVKQDCQKELHVINDELGKIKKNNELVEEFLQDTANTLQKAEELQEASWGLASIIIGGGLGTFAGSATGTAMAGPLGGIAGTFTGLAAGAKAFHEREGISKFVMGADPKPVPEKPTLQNPVSWKFNEHSTGFWGRYIKKRQSYTEGQVSIELGAGETVSYKFNLNDIEGNRSPISQKDLVDLGNKLKEQLKTGRITSCQCEQILNKLENTEIDRGTHHSKAKGLIRRNTPASQFLRKIATHIESETALPQAH